MAEIGAGGGSGYPGALDTNSTLEVDGSTLARADVPNDLAAAVIAIQTELGTDPAGTKTDVKTFLQASHQTDGTHWTRASKTDDYTVTTSDNMTLFEAGTSGGDVTFTLPTLSSATDNFLLAFKKTHASNSMILDGNSSETIDGATTQTYTSDDDYVIIWSNGSDNWIIVSDPGLQNIVEDTSPQLGGSLDVNGQSIVSASNGNIAVTPNGTGDVILDGLKWPQADGTANYVLKTNGSAQLSWTSQAGKVLQVVQTTKLDTFSMTSTTMADVTGLSVAITPASTSNKVLVFCMISGGGTNASAFNLLRGTTNLLVPSSPGSRSPGAAVLGFGSSPGMVNGVTIMYLDSPSSTSATTYKIQTAAVTAEANVNCSSEDNNDASQQRATSTITAIEIGA